MINGAGEPSDQGPTIPRASVINPDMRGENRPPIDQTVLGVALESLP